MRKLIDISPLIRKRPYISPQVSFEEEELEELIMVSGNTTDTGQATEGNDSIVDPNDHRGLGRTSTGNAKSIFDESDFEFSVDLGY